MILVIFIDLIVLASLIFVSMRKGLEDALPMAACFLIFFPEEAKLQTGLFDITTQRFITIVLLLLSMQQKGSALGPIRKMPLKGGIIAIALWWTVSTLFSISFMDSLKALLSLLLDYLAIYYLFAKHITSVNTIRRIMYGVVGGLILCSFFGALEAYANWSIISIFPTESHRFGSSGALYVDDARGLRVQSTFGHPILFGSALAMGIPLALYLIANTKTARRKTFLWIGLLLMFLSIFKASSRGPWIALVLSLVPFLFFGQRQTRKYILVICMLTVGVLIGMSGVRETLWNDYLATVDDHSSQGESYQYRYVLYRLVEDKLDESPDRALWGYGPQSFPFLHLTGFINGRGMNFVSCDSSLAALLVETGYVGFALMCLFLAYVLYAALRTAIRIGSPNNQICMLFVVNLAAFYFEMTNVAILGWGQQSIYLWSVIAMTMIFPTLVAQEKAMLSVLSEERFSDLTIDHTMVQLSLE